VGAALCIAVKRRISEVVVENSAKVETAALQRSPID